MPTIDGFGIERGTVFLPSDGIWSAELVPFDDAVLEEGQRVKIVVGDLTLSGTITTGGVLVSGGGVYVVGGAGGWRKSIAARAYRDDAGGVKLAGVLKDLAKDTGEDVELAESLSGAIVGPAWTRLAGTAAEALDVLGRPWRVRAEGVTEVGPLVTRAAPGIVSLRRPDPAHRRAIVEFPDDEVASVVPGSVIDLAEDFTITVASAAITITSGTIRARLTSA